MQRELEPHLPTSSKLLFEAKAKHNLTFEDLAQKLNRSEVAIAALFYGQATASAEDVKILASTLNISEDYLTEALCVYPNRGTAGPMPPKDPLIYRLYEIVQNYGYSFKAVLNEKFGDGIMSAIAFSTKVEKEVDEQGNAWAVITLRGKWYAVTHSRSSTLDEGTNAHRLPFTRF